MDAARAGATGRVSTSPGTVLLALALAAYALAMTLGRGRFGLLNLALLLAATGFTGAFVRVEARSASPLVRLTIFHDKALRASLVASGLVSTVIMATMVVGPFYLSRTLRLDAGRSSDSSSPSARWSPR